jgi:hypothetical protein
MDQPVEDFPFEELPPELQSKILRSLSSEEGLKSVSLKLTKPVYKQTIHKILEDECNKAITPNEVNKYLKNYEPLVHAKFFFSKDKEEWCYITEIKTINDTVSNLYIGLMHPLSQYIGDIELGNFGIIQALNLKAYMGVNDNTVPFEYDLMTTYYCYRDRISCMNLDNEYAKNKVIDYFEDTMTSVDYEDALVFLRTNAKIMGINVKGFPKYYEGEYDPGEIIDKKIEEEVEILEKLVRKRLHSLD